MNNLSRRLLLIGSSAFFVNSLIWCSTGSSTNTGNIIIENADEALDNLFSIAPDSYSIYEKSAGTLIIPKITKAGFIFGGSYGEGVLKIGGANVDFYSGILYQEIGIPVDLFTPIFAVSRTSGWLAHWIEQVSNNKIFRPTQNYIGQEPRELKKII